MNIFKKPIWLILSLVAALSLGACESDELCENTINTPRLIVRFKDESNQTKTKTVSNLIVYGRDNTSILSNASLDSLALPLKVSEPSTTYVMVSDASYDSSTGTITSGSVATVTFTYEIKQEFVSKACGFKVTYGTVSATLENASDSWIQSIEIKNTTVNNESSAQIYLYH